MSKLTISRTQIIVLVILALLTCGVIAAGGFLLFSLANRPLATPPLPAETATATLTPTQTTAPTSTATVTPEPTSTLAPTESDWNRIQQSGTLVVGTSADYPPFEYYNQDFQLEGFDIVLIRAIAAQLGLNVEFKNMAFDGLFDALALKQIDAAIAAISVTPERSNMVFFSDLYLASQDAILAQQDSPITEITNLQQLVGMRIGVQQFSVYESWLKTNLVDAGLIPSSDLEVFVEINDAVTDLKAGLLDVVVMDLLPAQQFAAEGGLKIVGQGLNRQNYAIALPYGTVELQTEINRALGTLRDSGQLDEIAQQYLGVTVSGISLPLGTPIAAQAPTSTPPGYCINGMQFVQDLSYPDNNMTSPPELPPGTPFRKGWRVRNVGTCTWNGSYNLTYVGGNSPLSGMGGNLIPVAGAVGPGQEYDIYLDLVSPLSPGVYQGFWQLLDNQGAPFGERVWVGIRVLPFYPSTPFPILGAPLIQRFGIFPSDEIHLGACVAVRWEVIGEVTDVSITRNEKLLRSGAPLSGQLTDCPPSPGIKTYRIEAVGPGGEARAADDVRVLESPEPKPKTPTPKPPLAIVKFNVHPNTVTSGQCFSLEWTVDGYVNLIQLKRNGDVILDNAPNPGIASDCPTAAGNYTYRLEAKNKFGESDSADKSVSVTTGPAAYQPDVWQRAWNLLLFSVMQVLD
jgi:ABC-type amino acid transport substrate-binding protein